MPHVNVDETVPGILSLMNQYPDSAGPLNALAEVLLRGRSPISPGHRELIAAVVSSGNQTQFCRMSHAAAARILLGPNEKHLVDAAILGELPPASGLLRSLLAIAEKVRSDPMSVAAEDIQTARNEGADDRAIHDTVLIAAAFCMYNRYVDGLATVQPDADSAYEEIGQRLARSGYVVSGAHPVPDNVAHIAPPVGLPDGQPAVSL